MDEIEYLMFCFINALFIFLFMINEIFFVPFKTTFDFILIYEGVVGFIF